MWITHLEGSRKEAILLAVESDDPKYTWVMANDEEVNVYESDTLEDLEEQAGVEEWEIGEEFTLEWLIRRMPYTEVDCDSSCGEALFIDGKLVSKSEDLTIYGGELLAVNKVA